MIKSSFYLSRGLGMVWLLNFQPASMVVQKKLQQATKMARWGAGTNLKLMVCRAGQINTLVCNKVAT